MRFGETELEDIIAVGATSDASARVWIRVSRPGRYVVEVSEVQGESRSRFSLDVRAGPEDGTCALTVPHDVPGGRPLRPCTRYAFTLMHDGRCLATAYGWTAPASRARAPRRFSFGAFSCHQPFAPNGRLIADAESMLQAACRAFEESDVRFVLMMGDQTYADYPENFSLFDPSYFASIAPPGRRSLLECTRAEVRAIYQHRHRIFWACDDFQKLQRRFASYPMLDDHEIVDNFGTHSDHGTPAWAAVREGALDAFYDYQAVRVARRPLHDLRPACFDYGFTWGSMAVWGMDVRSNRRTLGNVTRVYSDAQLQALTGFLSAHGTLPLAVVMLPIPLVHLHGGLVTAASRFWSRGSDLHERWSHPQCREARDRLVVTLLEHARAHPWQTLLLLSGDVHCGAAFRIDFGDGLRIHQLTSSAISNGENFLIDRAAEWAARESPIDVGDRTGDVTLLPGIDARSGHNPFGALNAGLVDVTDHGDVASVRLSLVSHDGKGGPRIVFDSGELSRVDIPRPAWIGQLDARDA